MISFRGEIIPVLSLFREPLTSSRFNEKAVNYAIILSLSGVKFAVEAKEVPRVISGPQPSDSRGDKLCRMRQRHLERLLRLHVSEGEFNTIGTTETGQEESPGGKDGTAP